MARKRTRERIVETADQLIYRHGYDHTSFADIAGAVQISRGNFYHHFKSKDEILDAVIERRLAATQAMLDEWERASDTPLERLRSFVLMLRANRTDIMRHGCPVGTLCSELAKLNHGAQTQAKQLFTLFRTWLRRQFTLLGRRADADDLAMELLSRSQGAATLANAFHDGDFIEQEITRMCAWLESCAPCRTTRRS